MSFKLSPALPAGSLRIGNPYLLVFLFILVFSSFPGSAKIPGPGDPAPAFNGRDSAGKMIYSSDYFGPNRPKNNGPARPAVILMFSSQGCPPCERMLPALTRFYLAWNPAGVEILLIRHREKPQELQTYQREHKVPFPVLSDQYGTIAQSYGVIAFPKIFILNPAGKITRTIIGEDTNLSQTLEKEMAKLGVKTQPKPEEGNK